MMKTSKYFSQTQKQNIWSVLFDIWICFSCFFLNVCLVRCFGYIVKNVFGIATKEQSGFF